MCDRLLKVHKERDFRIDSGRAWDSEAGAIATKESPAVAEASGTIGRDGAEAE